MATTQEVKAWLDIQLAPRLGAALPEVPGEYPAEQCAPDELLLADPSATQNARTYPRTTASILAEMYQPYLPATLPAGQLAQADFDTLRAAVDPVHQAFLDGCRAEGLI